MSDPAEKDYVIDHWYFLNPSEVRTKRYRADSYDGAVERALKLYSMPNTSRVRISRIGSGKCRSALKVWQK